MNRSAQLGVRVPPDLKTTLTKHAQAEDRSLASLVERILREWLAAQEPIKTRRKKDG